MYVGYTQGVVNVCEWPRQIPFSLTMIRYSTKPNLIAKDVLLSLNYRTYVRYRWALHEMYTFGIRFYA